MADFLGAKEHRTAKIDLRVFGGSALTSAIEVPKGREQASMTQDIPVTYVPARNTIFLSFALAWAEVQARLDIFIGVNALDYSGYPDCRPEFIEAFERMANLATKAGVEGRTQLRIHTPLLRLTKAEIVALARELGLDFSLTHSCYDPDAGGSPVRAVRFLPAAAKGIRRGRHRGSAERDEIAEIFYSIQGEGSLVGVPSVFVRTSGCNLRCAWCDTPYTSWNPEGNDLHARRDSRAGRALTRRAHVVVTGGEPMIAPRDRGAHAAACARADCTSPSRRRARCIAPVACDLMSISPKLANSTPMSATAEMGGAARAAAHFNRTFCAD